jgi:CheY-like chemotaxis protein
MAAGLDNTNAKPKFFAPGNALSRARILYVDGEAHRREVMRRILLRLGAADVQVAGSADDALKMLLMARCNLILVVTEDKMNSMDGIDIVRQIRCVSNRHRALTPVLMLADRPVPPEAVSAAMKAGANLFAIKPLSPEQLYERLVWTFADRRPLVIEDGHYIIRHGKAPPPPG